MATASSPFGLVADSVFSDGWTVQEWYRRWACSWSVDSLNLFECRRISGSGCLHLAAPWVWGLTIRYMTWGTWAPPYLWGWSKTSTGFLAWMRIYQTESDCHLMQWKEGMNASEFALFERFFIILVKIELCERKTWCYFRKLLYLSSKEKWFL